MPSYEAREISRALSGVPEYGTLRMKITGDHGETRWLTVTPEQVRAIRTLLTASVEEN